MGIFLIEMCAIVCGAAFLSIPILFIVWVVMLVTKNRKKKTVGMLLLIAVGLTILSAIAGAFFSPTALCDHSWQIVEEKAPTHVDDGYIIRRCALCDKEKTETIKAEGMVDGTYGHEYKPEVIRIATCTESGLIHYYCEICGGEYDEEVPMLEHSGDERMIKTGTLDKSGEKEIKCDMCGQTIIEETGTLGWNYAPLPIDPYKLYSAKDAKYQNKWVEVTGTVKYISKYSDMCGYYLIGTQGNGLVCWVYDGKLVANTGSKVTFKGMVVEALGDNVEITYCTLVNEVEVKSEPGMKKTDPIKVDEITSLHTDRWVEFGGTIQSIIPYGDAGYWYYLTGDIACLSEEVRQSGEYVEFIGKVMSVTDLWTTVADCEFIE